MEQMMEMQMSRHVRRAARPLAMATIAASAGVADGAQAAPTHVIATDGMYVTQIGSFRPAADPSLRAAARAFGRPSSLRLRGSTCIVDWDRLRLRIHFEHFGIAPGGATTCDPGVGRAQIVVARGDRFRTAAGLRIGDPTARIPMLYPDAEFRDGRAWALVLARFPWGDGGLDPVLNALPANGRVAALVGYVGAAGE